MPPDETRRPHARWHEPPLRRTRTGTDPRLRLGTTGCRSASRLASPGSAAAGQLLEQLAGRRGWVAAVDGVAGQLLQHRAQLGVHRAHPGPVVGVCSMRIRARYSTSLPGNPTSARATASRADTTSSADRANSTARSAAVSIVRGSERQLLIDRPVVAGIVEGSPYTSDKPSKEQRQRFEDGTCFASATNASSSSQIGHRLHQPDPADPTGRAGHSSAQMRPQRADHVPEPLAARCRPHGVRTRRRRLAAHRRQ